MVRKLVRDESGMTMGLAIIMIVLIGVMGAGLLTFVQRDLNSVIEENKGQRALDIADAGVQAAKAHLRQDSFRQHYDEDPANDCAEAIRVGGDNWSRAPDIYTDPDGYCVGPSTRTDNAATPWREDQGVTKLFGGGRFHVTIECFDQLLDGVCIGGAEAPEDVDPAEEKFFKITSTGYDTEAGDGAVRKIEAIYTTSKNTYVPLAYWTPRSIEFSGVRCVERMSFFAGWSITGATHGSPACGSNPEKIIANRSFPPYALYRAWEHPPYNITPRRDASNTLVEGAGFGAVRLVCGFGVSMTNCENINNTHLSVANGYHDYDSTTGNSSRPTCALANCATRGIPFVETPTNPANEITFPFEEGNAITKPEELVDAGLLEEMQAAAADQGNCHGCTGTGLTGYQAIPGDIDWPAEAGQDMRLFVNGEKGAADPLDVHFRICTPGGPPWPKGVIVVRNGNFQFDNACGGNAGFEGVVIVVGDGITTGKYTQQGQYDLDGYVAASGKMTIGGAVRPRTSIDFENLNSFYDVKLWSWREVYEQ